MTREEHIIATEINGNAMYDERSFVIEARNRQTNEFVGYWQRWENPNEDNELDLVPIWTDDPYEAGAFYYDDCPEWMIENVLQISQPQNAYRVVQIDIKSKPL